MLLFISCRPNWIGIYGARFYRGEFVCFESQDDDDLPVFGKITDILVLVKTPLIAIEKFRTEGINNHLLAYQISHTHSHSLLLQSNLSNKCTFCAHTYIGDENLYITVGSHIEFEIITLYTYFLHNFNFCIIYY